MHELSVMSYLLEAVDAEAQRHGAARVLAINLVMGERSSIIDDSLLFYFDMLAPGTRCAGAHISVRRTRMTFHCDACDSDYHRVGDDFGCPRCGQIGQALGDGGELSIESIEIEQ